MNPSSSHLAYDASFRRGSTLLLLLPLRPAARVSTGADYSLDPIFVPFTLLRLLFWCFARRPLPSAVRSFLLASLTKEHTQTYTHIHFEGYGDGR